MMNTTSVVMATYNGEKFIKEQLESILYQTYSPDEVIISDDNSSDHTINIIAKFISEHQLEKKWKLVINEKRKGVTKNFIDAANLATGDYLFFSDQDDIWEKDKIEEMRKVLMDDSVSAVSCTAVCIDSDGKNTNSLYGKIRSGNGKLHLSSFSEQIKNTRSSGHTLAFRKNILKEVSKWITEYDLPFDLPFALYSAAMNKKFALLQKPLVRRRVHDNNTSSPTFTFREKVKNLDERIKSIESRLKLMQACYLFFGETIIGEKDYHCLERSILFLENHLIHLKKKNIVKLFGDIFYSSPMVWKILLIVDFLSGIYSYKDQTFNS